MTLAPIGEAYRTTNHEILRAFVENADPSASFEIGSTVVLRAPVDEDEWTAVQRHTRRELLKRSVEYAALLHPSIAPQILDIEVGMGRGDVIMASRWVGGTTLTRHIRAKYPTGAPLEIGLQWTREIVQSLKTLHDNGLVHRHLTPDNVLISDDGTAYLIGFSSIIPRESRPSQLIEGVSQRYSAPEIIRELSGSFITPKADVFSVGGVMAYIFSGKELTDTPEAPVPVEGWTRLGEFPDGIRLLVAHCMQPMHKNRLDDAGELLAFLTVEDLPTKFTKPFGGVYITAPWLGSGDESRIGHLSPGPLVSRSPADVIQELKAQKSSEEPLEASKPADVVNGHSNSTELVSKESVDDQSPTSDKAETRDDDGAELKDSGHHPAFIPKEDVPYFARRGIPPIAIIFGTIFVAALVLALIRIFQG